MEDLNSLNKRHKPPLGYMDFANWNEKWKNYMFLKRFIIANKNNIIFSKIIKLIKIW